MCRKFTLNTWAICVNEKTPKHKKDNIIQKTIHYTYSTNTDSMSSISTMLLILHFGKETRAMFIIYSANKNLYAHMK